MYSLRMANQYKGTINKFEVQDGSKKATVEGNWTPPHPGPFKLSDDSDTEFLAMCDICASNTFLGAGPVTITVQSGSPDEIDVLSISPT
jgi:hypothetical protein